MFVFMNYSKLEVKTGDYRQYMQKDLKLLLGTCSI